jgi:hypothetical protein
MSFFDNAMLKVDESLTSILGEWDIYTTTLAAGLIVFFTYTVFTRRDPDTHPMLLERQASASAVRHEGESAVYRSHSAPHGMELNSGLNVRDPGISKWMRGRDGDLRDVWRKVVNGATNSEGVSTGEQGKILTVLGSEKVVEHNLGTLILTLKWEPVSNSTRSDKSADRHHRRAHKATRWNSSGHIPPQLY